MPNEFGSLKLGVAFGLFNCMYKTLYLKYKSKLWIFSNLNEFVSTKESKHFGKCTYKLKSKWYWSQFHV